MKIIIRHKMNRFLMKIQIEQQRVNFERILLILQFETVDSNEINQFFVKTESIDPRVNIKN